MLAEQPLIEEPRKALFHGIITPIFAFTLNTMIKESLFAAEEREAKLDQPGDVLQLLEKHVDFAVLAAIDCASTAPREKRTPAIPDPGHGEGAVPPAALQPQR